MSAAPTEKLKILCLHGFRQNAAIFRSKTGAFRSAMKKHADFVIVDAPIDVEQMVDEEGNTHQLKGWWIKKDDAPCEGLVSALDFVKDLIASEKGGFHGILGFSQGASVAAILAQQLQNGEFKLEHKFSFVIMIAGFVSDYQKSLLNSTVNMKSLIAIGENDNIIPKDMSESLMDYFIDAEVLYHPGGHGIPLRAAQKKTFNNFFTECKGLCFLTEFAIFVPNISSTLMIINRLIKHFANSQAILCLHGYRQSGQGFREKTGAVRKVLKKYAEFVFFDAPHHVGAEQGGSPDNNHCLGWWFSREDDYYKAVEYSDIDKGFAESLECFCKFYKEQGPFDGVIGFSQGACFLTVICGMIACGELDLELGFVMLYAGFKSRCSPHDMYYSNPSTVPALLCIGEGDDVIPLEFGDEVVTLYKDPVVVHHPGGHFIPNQPDQRKAYIDFLTKMIEKKTSVS